MLNVGFSCLCLIAGLGTFCCLGLIVSLGGLVLGLLWCWFVVIVIVVFVLLGIWVVSSWCSFA